ncbi:MAG TPA: cell death suppressor protein Lls1, partial [Cyanobacteria bacterium UBA11049]|nr:cell death suppressor protein Lls1 [Cyanobacteria bacterium UBA11049]
SALKQEVLLHHQERYLEAAGGSANFNKAFYLPTLADTFVSELRQWVNQYSVDPFPETTLPPPLPREKLLDRYHSHTQKCGSCRSALANIQRLRNWLAITAAIAIAMIPLLAVLGETSFLASFLSTTVILVLGATLLGLGKLERQLYEGRNVPLRNLPD